MGNDFSSRLVDKVDPMLRRYGGLVDNKLDTLRRALQEEIASLRMCASTMPLEEEPSTTTASLCGGVVKPNAMESLTKIATPAFVK